jgi:hypothetical protein
MKARRPSTSSPGIVGWRTVSRKNARAQAISRKEAEIHLFTFFTVLFQPHSVSGITQHARLGLILAPAGISACATMNLLPIPIWPSWIRVKNRAELFLL